MLHELVGFTAGDVYDYVDIAGHTPIINWVIEVAAVTYDGRVECLMFLDEHAFVTRMGNPLLIPIERADHLIAHGIWKRRDT